MALAYLARWGGPVNESDDAYADGSHPTGLAVRRQLSEVVFVPGRTSATDNEQIKDAVMTYGAVDTGMYWTSGSYNAATCAVPVLRLAGSQPRRRHRRLGRRLPREQLLPLGAGRRRLPHAQQLGLELGRRRLLLGLLLRRRDRLRRLQHGLRLRRPGRRLLAQLPVRPAGLLPRGGSRTRAAPPAGRPTSSPPRRTRTSPPSASTRPTRAAPTRSGSRRRAARRPSPACSRRRLGTMATAGYHVVDAAGDGAADLRSAVHRRPQAHRPRRRRPLLPPGRAPDRRLQRRDREPRRELREHERLDLE